MNQAKDWVAYVGPFPFPWGQAASRRMYGVALSISACGYRVVVGTGESEPESEMPLSEDFAPGIHRVGLSESPRPHDSTLVKSLRIFYEWGKKTVDWLESSPSRPAFIVVYGGGAPYAARLLRWGHKRNVPVIFDVVEWYESSHFVGGRLNPFSVSSEIAMRCLYPRADGIIAISSFLENFYRGKGRKVLRIPPTLDVHLADSSPPIPRPMDADSRLKLIYAGTPGKKDSLGTILAAVRLVDPAGDKLKLDVLGVGESQASIYKEEGAHYGNVEFHGVVRQSDVAKFLMAADFSVLVREPLRFAQAGFPTKFVESLCAGTPVIANLTSDIGMYLSDGVNGLTLVDCSVHSLVDGLKRALGLSADALCAMRAAARSSAIDHFDSGVYVSGVREFLSNVKHGQVVPAEMS